VDVKWAQNKSKKSIGEKGELKKKRGHFRKTPHSIITEILPAARAGGERTIKGVPVRSSREAPPSSKKKTNGPWGSTTDPDGAAKERENTRTPS